MNFTAFSSRFMTTAVRIWRSPSIARVPSTGITSRRIRRASADNAAAGASSSMKLETRNRSDSECPG